MSDYTDEIKKRLEAATPGPWESSGDDVLKLYPGGSYGRISEYSEPQNAKLIANAPTDIKNLLEEREVLREALNKYAKIKDATVSDHCCRPTIHMDFGFHAREALAWEPKK